MSNNSMADPLSYDAGATLAVCNNGTSNDAGDRF
jgi:hypothetical protein